MLCIKLSHMILLIFNHFFDLEKQLFHIVLLNTTSSVDKCQKSKWEALLFLLMTMSGELNPPLPTLTPPVLTRALRLRASHLCVSMNSQLPNKSGLSSLTQGQRPNIWLKESHLTF